MKNQISPLPPKSTKWAVFLDLDGTLFGEGHTIPQRNLDAMAAARAKGHLILVNTGRSLGHVPAVVTEDLVCDGIITGNGAMITMGDAVLQDAFMPPSLIGRVADYVFGNKDCWALFEGKYQTYALTNGIRPQKPGQIPIDAPKDLEQFCSGDRIQVIALGKTAPQEFIAQFREELTVIQFENYADVSMKGITKATGMEKVLSAVGIDRAHSIAIGDSGNDRAMLEYAGIGIAMANSEKALLKAADDITASNLDCGVANAIEKYLL